MICLTPVNIGNTARSVQGLDAWLLETAQGDTCAFAQLYTHTSAAVYGFALSILKNAHDAEDVLHDTFLSIRSAAQGYRPMGKPMAWILTIARNLCMARLRQRSRDAQLTGREWESLPDADPVTDAQDRMILAQYLHALSDEERQIVTLHALAGFRHREIAEITGMPLPTVLSKYHRALKKLKQNL